MKKLIYTIAGSLIITCGYAQTDSTGQKGSSTDYNSTTDTISTNKSRDNEKSRKTTDTLSLKSHDNNMNSSNYPTTMDSKNKDNHKATKDYTDGVIMKADGIIMQDGKMCMVKDNIVTPLNQEITLDNGTRVMVDGSYSTKDGKKKTLQEGEHLDMMGKINPKE